MPVDHLIEFNDLMPDRLEMELIKKGDISLTPLGLEKMRPDLELSKEAIKSLYRRSKSNEPKSVITQLPDLVRTASQIATFKAGDKRKTTHQCLAPYIRPLIFGFSNKVSGTGGFMFRAW